MEVIPLIQCLGHMETPLRLDDYAHLREVPWRADALNPLLDGSRQLIQSMIDDVLKLSPSVRYLHLGGDESWTLGKGPQTKAVAEAEGLDALYLRQVRPLLDNLKGRDIQPMLWHDMMVEWPDESLDELAGLCDLVAWTYGEDPRRLQTGHCQMKYIKRFQEHDITVWGGLAYKGADGPEVDRPDLNNRLTNARVWREIADEDGLAGLIATAWSRYNTHGAQCEPIDGCLDALVLCGQIINGRPIDSPEETIVKSILEPLGEWERFTCCRDVLVRLDELREMGWVQFRRVMEIAAMSRHQTHRLAEISLFDPLVRVRKALADLDALSVDFHKAYEGLIEPVWIEEYLYERIVPLQRLYDTVNAEADKLNPTFACQVADLYDAQQLFH
jgi:hexosaminidase